MPQRFSIHAALSHAGIRSALLAAALTGLVLALFPFATIAVAGDHAAPTQPQNLRVLAVTQTTVTLAWDASTDDVAVTGYNVWVWPSALKRPMKPRATTPLTTYVATGLSCGQSYKVRLTATDGKNESTDTKALVSTAPCVDTQAPSVPTGLQQITTGATSATLSWKPASDNVAVAGYSVSRAGVELGTTSATSYTFSGLACGRSYSVGVRSYDVSTNYSPWASFYVATAACGDTSPPTAPTGLVQTSTSTTGMSVAWKASTDNVGVARYGVFVNGTKQGSTSSLSYVLANLACGVSYSVGVTAADAAGNVSGTTTATMSTSPCVSSSPPPSPSPDPPASDTQSPTSPSNLALAAATPTSMDLTWSPSTDNVGVTGYGAYLDGTRLQTVTGTSFDFSGQACGTSHHLSVEAYDAAGNTSPRAAVAASTSPCSSDTSPPTAPSNPVVLNRTSTSVTLSWAASTDDVGVAGYDGYVGGVLAGKTSATTYTFTGMACNTNQTFSIDAYDAAGNQSAKVNVAASTTACTDSQAPTAPSQLTVTNATQTDLTLDWAASTDNTGVAGYDVFVNGTKAMTVTATEATLGNLTCNTVYRLGVQAFDGSGNRSSTSTVSGTTAACSSSPPPSSPSGTGKTITVPAGGSWNSCYQQASPGDVCKLSAGSYGAQIISWRGDLAGRCDRNNPATLVRFDASAAITVNGDVEVDTGCVGIIGASVSGGYSLDVKGEVSTYSNVSGQVPDNVLFQNLHSVHFGAFSSDHVTFSGIDVGPATVVQQADGSCAASEGSGDENKIAWSGLLRVPTDILVTDSVIHNQQGRNPDRGNCHYGGLFIVNVNGLLIRNTVFYGNVVYNVQIQNFAGPSPTGIVFDSNRFGCPVDWLDRGAPCDGQKSIQLNTTSTGITGTIKNNVTANGQGGTFGCMVSGCSPSGIALQNNTELADSTTPP